ncbi:MAG: hypothetical protein AAF382_05305 [Pseudomonadota bacterium]
MFWTRPLVSDDLRHWIFECFDWFDTRFTPPLGPILPTRAFFDAPGGNSPETAKLVVRDIQRHLAFHDPVELLPLDVLPAEYRHDYNALSSITGSFEQTGDVAIIRYDPEQMNHPIRFINLMTHELMHARLAHVVSDVPGGAGAHELATDLGCIIAGFGVFQLQAADDAGWFGYMTQDTRAFALAVFLSRRDLDLSSVATHLSTRCCKLVARGLKAL